MFPRSFIQIFYNTQKNGGERTITAPNKKLAGLQRNVTKHLVGLRKFKPCVNGFVVGRSIKTNAEFHLKKTIIFNIDLLDFFDSITSGRVYGMLTSEPYKLNSRIAHCITSICTHNNKLPQGAPSSPQISNMICAKLDSELFELAKISKAFYTRYADDITFSTRQDGLGRIAQRTIEDNKPTLKISPDLREIIESNGFDINFDKVRTSWCTNRQTVTGLTVNDKFPNLDRRFIRQIRAMLHDWEKNGYEKASKSHNSGFNNSGKEKNFSHTVRGKINFIRQIRGSDNEIFQRFGKKFNELEKHGKNIDIAISPQDLISQATWVLEYTNVVDKIPDQGTVFLLDNVGWVTCWHCIGKEGEIEIYHPQKNKKYLAEVKKWCGHLDLAILDVKGLDGIKPLKYRCKSFSSGDKVIAAGYPNCALGDTITTISCPIIRTKDSDIKSGYLSQYCGLDSRSISEGMSGGPLTTENGEVIGVIFRDSNTNYQAINIKHLIEKIHAKTSPI